MQSFFLWCSGVNINILKKYPDEVIKYASAGAAVFLTALLAILTGGYALYTVFHHIGWALLFGMIWGAIIFNLDRYIVSSFHKKDKWIEELPSALPRVLVATVIAIVIANPLELKIFEKEIDTQISKTIDEDITQHRQNSNLTFRIKEIQGDISKDNKSQELIDKKLELKKWNDELIKEIQGRVGSNKFGDGPAAAQIREHLKQLELDIAKLEPQTDNFSNTNNATLQELKKQLDLECEQKKVELNKNIGFLARNVALGQLQSNKTVLLTSWFIKLLLWILELAPILVKLFSKKEKYDDEIEMLLSQQKIQNQKEISIKSAEALKEIETKNFEVAQLLAEENARLKEMMLQNQLQRFIMLKEELMKIVPPTKNAEKFEETISQMIITKALETAIHSNKEMTEDDIKQYLNSTIKGIKGKGTIDENTLRKNIDELSSIIKSLPENIAQNIPTIVVDRTQKE